MTYDSDINATDYIPDEEEVTVREGSIGLVCRYLVRQYIWLTGGTLRLKFRARLVQRGADKDLCCDWGPFRPTQAEAMVGAYEDWKERG